MADPRRDAYDSPASGADFINLVADKIRQSRANDLGAQAGQMPGGAGNLGFLAAQPPLPPGAPTSLGGLAAMPDNAGMAETMQPLPPNRETMQTLDPEQVNAALRYLTAKQNGQLQ